MSNDNRTRKLVRQVERETRTGKREVARSKAELEREEKALIAEIKKYARLGDKAMCSKLAQQLISVRKHIGQNVRMSAEMSQIGNQARLGAAQYRLMTVAQGTTKAMTAVNSVSSLIFDIFGVLTAFLGAAKVSKLPSLFSCLGLRQLSAKKTGLWVPGGSNGLRYLGSFFF